MIDITDEGLVKTEVPELAQEFAKRLVGGMLKAARSYVPTRENAEGKKEHCDVSLLNGAIYVGTDHSLYAAVIRLKLAELCKKKSPLRAAVETLADNYSARLNYGVASPWLKTHEKNIRYAEIGPDGIRLMVAPGIVELDLSPTEESTAYGESIATMLTSRVLDDFLESGPHPLPGDAPAGAAVLVVTPDGASYSDAIDLESTALQMKFKPSLLPGKDCEVRVYADPEGGKIVRITTDEPTMHVDQFFRVLELHQDS
jgi:hypothetical protein